MFVGVAFPTTITRRRTAPGSRNEYGEWQPGVTTETTLPANVQPLALDDVDTIAGAGLVERVKVYVPDRDGLTNLPVGFSAAFNADFYQRPPSHGPLLAAAFDEAEADVVIHDGREYTVESSVRWGGSHVRAIAVRAT